MDDVAFSNNRFRFNPFPARPRAPLPPPHDDIALTHVVRSLPTIHRRLRRAREPRARGGRRSLRRASEPGPSRRLRGQFGAPASPTPAGGGLFGAPASTPAGGGGLFGAPAASTPTAGGGGLFGASVPASTPAAGGGLFGASQPAAGGGLFGASQPATGGGLFGASQPAAGGGLFGASAPAAGGGLFGASAPAAGGGLFGSAAPSTGGGLFGASSAPSTGGGLFGAASAPGLSTGGGLFGASSAPSTGGGLFGASSAPSTGGGLFGGQPGNALALAQPQASFLSTTNGQPVRHYTQWGELTPQSQQQLKQLEAMIIAAREDSKLLDGVERLAEYQPPKKGSSAVGNKKGEVARPSPGANGKLTKGEIQRRDLERAAKATANRLKLLETQLWSDNDRLTGLTEAVVECLRDTEHAQARLQRLKDAHAADDLARSHALAHPNQPPPPAAAPVYLPAPRRPSPYLEKTVERLYATAEGFERGTLEMEHNLRTTGRVLGAGGGGAGHGLEALTAALHGHASSFPAIGSGGGGEDGLEKFDGGVAALKALRASRTGGPAEHRSAVEAARRYFNKVGGDLAKLHERVSRAKAAHLAKLREKGDHRDPFAEAEKEEEEARRLAELAERPEVAMALPAPGAPGQPLALPAPATGGGLSLTTPGGTSLFGAPAATGGGLFGGASASATGGGLFGASAPAATGGGLFGASAPAAPEAACSARPPRAATGGGLFGACPSGNRRRSVGGAAGGGRSVRRSSTPRRPAVVRRTAAAAVCSSTQPAAGGGLFGARPARPRRRRRLFGARRRRLPRRAAAVCSALRRRRLPRRAAAVSFGSPAPATPSLALRSVVRCPRDVGVWRCGAGGGRGSLRKPRARGGRFRRGRVWKSGAGWHRQAVGSKEVTGGKLRSTSMY